MLTKTLGTEERNWQQHIQDPLQRPMLEVVVRNNTFSVYLEQGGVEITPY